MDIQLDWLANLFSISTDRLSINGQDIFVDSNFRLGYRDGNMFFRENPVTRALRRHNVTCREGEVEMCSEPQYDMIITFNDEGRMVGFSDNRISMEADYLKNR